GRPYAATAGLLSVLGAAACLGFLSQFLTVVLLALDRAGRLLAVSAVTLTASLVLTPGSVLALKAPGGGGSLVALEAVSGTGRLGACLPFSRLPFGDGAAKTVVAAVAGSVAAGLAPPGGPWRLAAALGVYAGALVVLRPVPVALWGRLLRGALAPAAGPR